MEVSLPVRLTQCAAVSTTCSLGIEPPHPVDRRTIEGNSPFADGLLTIRRSTGGLPARSVVRRSSDRYSRVDAMTVGLAAPRKKMPL